MQISFDDTGIAYAYKTDAELRNADFIFSLINNPIICSAATNAVKWSLKVHAPVEGIIKKTVFAHFCGGDDISSSAPIIQKLGTRGVETILDYSVEGSDAEPDFDRTMEEVLRTIQNAGREKHIAFAVFKVTGVASGSLLEKIQAGTQLTADETESVQKLERRVDMICRAAHRNNVRLLIDAEESWIQGAIDRLVIKMMAAYNREKAIIFNTYQLYRTDALPNMIEAFSHAKEHGYHFGVKLVRGAYMEKERKRAKELGYPSPIHTDLESTNKAFNAALEYCINNLRQISLMCGSHNDYSNKYLAALMAEKRLKNNDPRIWFSQLYGMSDNISFNLARLGYNVAKYLPYGPVRSVMPYLLRRASENTSVAGQSSRELMLIRKEIRRRKTVGTIPGQQ